MENSGQLKRYRSIRVICDRTREVHHSKSRSYNGGLILLFGVGDGQAVYPGRLREDSCKKEQRQRTASYIQKATHELPAKGTSELSLVWQI